MATHQKHQPNPAHEAAQRQSKAKPAPVQPDLAALTAWCSPLALQRAIADPRAALPRDILALQRLAGNLYNLIGAGWRERKRATGKWFPPSEINQRCRALLATLGDLTVVEMVAGCYNDGYVTGRQKFQPMLDEVRKRAQQ